MIHVFYDPAGTFARSALQEKLLRFNGAGRKTKKGQPTMVAWLATTDYQKKLSTVVPRVKPDLLILNSPDEAVQFGPSIDIHEATNLCKPSGTCLAVIPTWVGNGDERQATIEVLKYLTQD